jgi:hypothetical protein
MLKQKGGGGGHPWHLWAQGFRGNGREVYVVGAPGHSGVRHLLHNNHKFHL